MNKLIGFIIIVALGYGYVNNKAKVHNLIGLDDATESDQTKSEDSAKSNSGIGYVKLDNINTLNVGVHLISASWCGYCTKLRTLMEKHNIPFTEYDSENDSVVDEFLEKNNIDGGVPVTVIGGDIVYGYDVDKLEKTFKRNNIAISGL